LLRELPGGPSLQDLAWLVGTWTFQHDGGEGRLTFEWTDNKTYLLCRTAMKPKDSKDTASTGVQILAIDPATGGLKSWTVEGDGSLGEAMWSRTEKGWSSKSTGVTADGDKVRATSTLTPTDENTFTWQMTDRTINGDKAPDVGPVKVTRERKTP